MAAAKQQIRFCTTRDGVRIAYAQAGDGPPLVRAANWFSHVEFDWTSPVCSHWHAELCRQHTYYRYDRRGCGLSDWDAKQSFDGYLSDLEAVVESAGLRRFPLFGMGHGGSVAVAYAARYPERVTHLLIYGSFARGRLKRNPTPQQDAEIEMQFKLAELGWGREDPAFRQFFTTQFMPDSTMEQARQYSELQRVSTSPEYALEHLHVVFEFDVTQAAANVRCPTLVLHAHGDMRNRFDEGRLLASLIPGARFVPLAGRNHFLQESEPAWGQFVAESRAFLPREGRERMDGALAQLTIREAEVLELIARGLDNAQIAATLERSEKTVRNHITAIFAKLEVESRAQAIVRARDAGYARLDRPH
jgi:pimeloyl-ACP methyl ester carboxylesterase/DNA-binding CsgD family transcriptional regulator